ncbi:324_t:CDS:2 [Gigaspora margarita]|uniref:324_t:CDS:1 n=1 Tax=Gigaspora margarita TaxID=4874 RepID=A0ABN7VKD3_GIGMA|nr:324_t:CDS:2 [Gigaspora margarita]
MQIINGIAYINRSGINGNRTSRCGISGIGGISENGISEDRIGKDGISRDGNSRDGIGGGKIGRGRIGRGGTSGGWGDYKAQCIGAWTQNWINELEPLLKYDDKDLTILIEKDIPPEEKWHCVITHDKTTLSANDNKKSE